MTYDVANDGLSIFEASSGIGIEMAKRVLVAILCAPLGVPVGVLFCILCLGRVTWEAMIAGSAMLALMGLLFPRQMLTFLRYFPLFFHGF